MGYFVSSNYQHNKVFSVRQFIKVSKGLVCLIWRIWWRARGWTFFLRLFFHRPFTRLRFLFNLVFLRASLWSRIHKKLSDELFVENNYSFTLRIDVMRKRILKWKSSGNIMPKFKRVENFSVITTEAFCSFIAEMQINYFFEKFRILK